MPLGYERTPSFVWGSHTPARHPILVPTACRAGFSPHRGCGLCLLCGEPLPAAQSWIDSGRAGGGAESERGREEQRGARESRSDLAGTAPRPLAPPPHYHEKEGPETCRDRVGASLGRGARSTSLFSTVPFLYTDSSPLAREKFGTLDFHPTPSFASERWVKTEGTSRSSSGQGIRPSAPKGGKLQLPACPRRPRRAPLPSVPCCSIQFI